MGQQRERERERESRLRSVLTIGAGFNLAHVLEGVILIIVETWGGGGGGVHLAGQERDW